MDSTERAKMESDSNLLIKIATTMEHIAKDLAELKVDFRSFKDHVSVRYVTREHHDVVTSELQRRVDKLERAMYGVAGLVITAVIVAVINLVVG